MSLPFNLPSPAQSRASAIQHPWQDAAAMLLACGRYSIPEIGRAVDQPLDVIYALRESPLFLTLVGEYQRRFSLTEAEGALWDGKDAKTTLEVLRDFRDGNVTGDVKHNQLRLRAAMTLFDKQYRDRPTTKDPFAGDAIDVTQVDAVQMRTMQELVERDAPPPLDDNGDEILDS